MESTPVSNNAFSPPMPQLIDDVAAKLLASFEIGQLVNQLGWHLTHFVMLGLRENQIQCRQVFSELTTSAFTIPRELASKNDLREWISARFDEWERLICSLEFGEDHIMARQKVESHQQQSTLSDREIVSLAYDDVITAADLMHSAVRIRLHIELDKMPEKLAAAYFLGETVDQLLRPKNVAGALFDRVRNPDWSKFVHRCPCRKSMSQAGLLPGESTSGPRTPPKTVLRGIPRRPGELPPPTLWVEAINSLCTQLGICVCIGEALIRKLNRSDRDPDILANRRRAGVKWFANLCRNELAKTRTVARIDEPHALTILDSAKTEILDHAEFDQYVRLDQAAAMVSRSKKTLERHLKNGKLPAPDVEGGGGKPHEWKWAKLRPALEMLFERKLPQKMPSNRSTHQ